MSFTILFALLAVALLVIVFITAYLIKGLKVALISTGVAAVLIVLLYVGFVAIATSSMG